MTQPGDLFDPAWQPVALAADIEPGTAAGTRLFGRELVVWRGAEGQAHIWQDRCPHRGMRLSFGFVRADRIACLYHGWQFDPSGRCRHIPAHPALNVPATIAATTYRAAEHLGILWTVGEGAPPGAAAAALPVRSLAVTCPADAAFAALLAITTTPLGPAQPARRAALVTLATADGAVQAAVQPRSATECTIHLTLAGPAGQSGIPAQISTWAEALRRTLEAP